jgi:hypothetical protein
MRSVGASAGQSRVMNIWLARSQLWLKTLVSRAPRCGAVIRVGEIGPHAIYFRSGGVPPMAKYQAH